MLDPGDPAPDFDLPGTDGDAVGVYRLSAALTEGPVVLVFYPFDFHPRSTGDLRAVRDAAWGDPGSTATVFGIGPDSAYSHRAYAREHGLGFALLSDRDGYFADRYDVPRRTVEHHPGVTERAVYVVGPDARVRYAWTAEGPEDDIDVDAVVAALADDGGG